MKTPKHYTLLYIVAAVVAVVVILLLATVKCSNKEETAEKQEAVDTIPVMATRISKCSKLYTSEYQLRKIVLYDDPVEIKGSFLKQNFHVSLPLGDRRIAIPVTATAKAYVDLSKITEDNIHRNGDKIEIVLPDPEVTLTSTKIDHKGVRSNVGLLRSNFKDSEITKIQQRGRKDLVASLSNMNIIESARASAAKQIIPIVMQLGFEEQNITITFRKDLDDHDVPTLIRYLD